MSSIIQFEYNLIDNPPNQENYSDNIFLFNNNFTQLQKGIDTFNSEIEWDDMWTINIAKDRLQNNWKLLVLIIDNKICGWNWLDYNNKQTHNLYVSKKYSNKGWGLKLKKSMLFLAQELKIDKLKCKVDDWNLNSIRVQEKCGYTRM